MPQWLAPRPKSTCPVSSVPGKIPPAPFPPGRPVPINAVCPECKTRFRLQDAMAGKLMRCTACQEMFTVFDAGPDGTPAPPAPEKAPPAESLPRTRVDAPAVVSRSGNVSDFVQVIHDVSPAAPPRPAPVPPPAPVATPPPVPVKPWEAPWAEKGIKPPTAADFPWDEGGKPKAKAGPKEIAWAPDVQPPSVPPPLPPVDLEPMVDVDELDGPEREHDNDQYARRTRPESDRLAVPARQRKKGRKLILWSMVAFIVVALGFGGYFTVRYINDAPERLMKAANDEYKGRNWDQARKLYEQLAREHPSHPLAPKAKFLAELTALRQATTSVMSRTNPQPGIDEWKKFMANPALAEFGAKGRFQGDVWDAGTKLEEDVLARANDTFNADNPDESDRWLSEATELDRAVDRFRDEEVPKNDRLGASLAELRGKIESARVVLAQLAELNKFAGEGPDAQERFDQEAMRLGLSKHPAVIARRAEREQQIQSKAVYTREPNPIPPSA